MVIHFNEGDVKVEQHYAREWTAHVVENYDYDSPMGHGSTMMEAIADLQEKIDAM